MSPIDTLIGAGVVSLPKAGSALGLGFQPCKVATCESQEIIVPVCCFYCRYRVVGMVGCMVVVWQVKCGMLLRRFCRNQYVRKHKTGCLLEIKKSAIDPLDLNGQVKHLLDKVIGQKAYGPSSFVQYAEIGAKLFVVVCLICDQTPLQSLLVSLTLVSLRLRCRCTSVLELSAKFCGDGRSTQRQNGNERCVKIAIISIQTATYIARVENICLGASNVILSQSLSVVPCYTTLAGFKAPKHISMTPCVVLQF